MERVWSTSRRGFSVRSILTFVLTVFIAALLWATFGSHTLTHAANASPATWKGDSILYDGHQYFAAPDATSGNSLGLPQGTHYYVYLPDVNGTAPKTQKAFVIYFTPGTDPPTEKSASYATYTFTLSTKQYSNPAGKQTITVTPQGSESSYSSCTIQGIGWIICPITTFLADGMDNIFNIVKGFLVVQPVNTTNTNNDLYLAWNVMRSVANVAFIIVFLIIIYSQITNVGISNYGLKKLLPRLIIAAVLVNMSYIICAAALDISNILGYAFQDLFNTIRENTFNISNETWKDSAGMGWSAITAFVLSGGVAGAGLLIATGGTVAGAIYLLIPILIGVITTVLLVLLILAARQAIIIILIVVAPLAFVAYLLPNTEQWFKKWRELFMTMLVFFPAFSLVFGGSQLAGGIIIQNATSIITVIFGLAIQVAPLVITPLILKLSGGLLGKIAGIVNDPRKGLLDRTKKWSGDRAEMHRRRGIGDPNLKRNQIFRRAARGLAYNNHRVEKRTDQYKAGFDEHAAKRDISTRGGQKVEFETALSKLATEEMHNDLGQAVQEARGGNGSGLARLRAQGVKITAADRAVAEDKKITAEEARLRRFVETKDDGSYTIKDRAIEKYAASVTKRAVHLDQSSRVIANATAIAQNQQVTRYAEAIANENDAIANTFLKVQAGGIAGAKGQAGALAAAFKAQSAAHGEAVANANSILSHYNYGDDVIGQIAKGQQPVGVKFKVTPTLEEAAIMKIASGSNAGALLDLMENIHIDESLDNQDFRQAFADAVQVNSARPKFAGASILADIKQGKVPADGKKRIDTYVAQTINADKLSSADTLVGQDRDYLKAVLKTLNNNESDETITNDAKISMLKSIEEMRANPIYSGRIGEKRMALKKIERRLRRDTGMLDIPEGAPDPFEIEDDEGDENKA
ncbi:MAG: rane protein of unknown function [Candidatus Saccharibacteria bacterium]|nr:rane protein of unknown function [Candidatus Saccharibacteria bacterium]